MTHWLGRLFVVLSLATSWGAQASLDTSPSVLTWCTSEYSMANYTVCYFPTDFAAAQKTISLSNEGSVQLHTADPTVEVDEYTLTSCDGNGNCATCVTGTQNNQIIFHSCGGIRRWAILIPVCPVPKSHPEIPYIYYAYGNDCYRYIPDNPALTITLTGGTEVEPSDDSTINTLPFIATVIDQNTGQPTTKPVQVHISLKVDPTSGGHDHGDSTRPRGSVADVQSCDPVGDGICWSNPTINGVVVFNFNPTDASGTHTITATCDGCTNTATANVDVKVDGLWPIPDSGYYALTEDGSSKVIGSTTDHVYNHYLTTTASMKLWRLAADFYNYQIQNGVTTPILLHLNDASLKWGGIFDLDTDWDEPHAEHRRGIVIDVRANSNPGAIPAADYAAFKQMAKQLKVDPYFEGDSTGQHFHLRLLNKRG